MNKALIFGLLTSLILLSIPHTSAQTPTITPTSTVTITPTITVSPTITSTVAPTPTPTTIPLAISTELLVGTQYPWNKQVPITVKLTPKISGISLVLRWPSKTGFTISPTTTTLKNVEKDKTYTLQYTFSPIGTGLQKFSAELVLTTSDKKYISSLPIEITLSQDKLVTPISDGYRQYEIAMYVAIGVLLFVIVPASLFFLFFYIKNRLIPKWVKNRLNQPL